MASKHHKPEEIVAKLRQVEVLLAQGRFAVEAVRTLGVTEQTYYRWRAEYGGLRLDQVRRLKQLEEGWRHCLRPASLRSSSRTSRWIERCCTMSWQKSSEPCAATPVCGRCPERMGGLDPSGLRRDPDRTVDLPLPW